MNEKQIIAKVHARLIRDANKRANTRIVKSHKRRLSVLTTGGVSAYYTSPIR